MATFEVLTSSNVVGGGGSGSSYLVYTAILTQTGTNAPVATVVENTLGGTLVWTRNGVGDYSATLAGAFTGTVISPLCGNLKNPASIMAVPLLDGNAAHPFYQLGNCDNNGFQMFIYSDATQGSFVELSAIAPNLSIMVEVKVY